MLMVGQRSGDAASGFDAVHTGHPHIHEDYIRQWTMLNGELFERLDGRIGRQRTGQ